MDTPILSSTQDVDENEWDTLSLVHMVCMLSTMHTASVFWDLQLLQMVLTHIAYFLLLNEAVLFSLYGFAIYNEKHMRAIPKLLINIISRQ